MTSRLRPPASGLRRLACPLFLAPWARSPVALLRAPRCAISLVIAGACFLLTAHRSLATEPIDLGQNLSYLRVHELADVAESVASVVPENRALVLDLRYAIASGGSASHLAAALAARTGPAPLLILVAPGTPAPLASALGKLPPYAITIGVKESVPAPRVVVRQPAEADRRAHAALDSGLPLAALINGKVEKERYDEASLVKDFSNGNRNPRPPPRPAPARRDPPVAPPAGASPGEPAVPAAIATTDDAADPVPVLTDRVLQRAVHLHRTLFAIRPR